MDEELKYTDIELAIVNYYGRRQHIIVPNCYINFGTVADHECDLLIIKQSGYADEVEIKMSKADLKADFKKKHGHNDERLKHLYYAMPADIYDDCKDLIPNCAGILTIKKYGDRCFVTLAKKATKKKCRKLTEYEQLKFARLGVLRFWNIKEKLHYERI